MNCQTLLTKSVLPNLDVSASTAVWRHCRLAAKIPIISLAGLGFFNSHICATCSLCHSRESGNPLYPLLQKYVLHHISLKLNLLMSQFSSMGCSTMASEQASTRLSKNKISHNASSGIIRHSALKSLLN